MKKLDIISNNIRALHNYRKRKTVLDNAPTFLWIEPTNHCNLHCIMCPNGSGMVNIKKGYMEYALYKKIIDEVRPYVSAVILSLGGESLLHPDFFDMVKYAASCGIKILLNTNATLLDRKKAHELLDSPISSISFAFDGFNKDMYEKARVGANFEETLANILYFLKLKKSSKKKMPYAVLSILELGLGDCQQQEREAFLKKFDGIIDEVRLREVSSWGSIFKDCDKFSHKRYRKLWTPCSRLWSSLCIAWNGDVIPCVYNMNHEYLLGNIKSERLLNIWNGRKAVQIRKAMVDGSYLALSPLCENCSILGTPPILGVPSGIRLTMTDALTNFFGYGIEKIAIGMANKLRKEKFSSVTIT